MLKGASKKIVTETTSWRSGRGALFQTLVAVGCGIIVWEKCRLYGFISACTTSSGAVQQRRTWACNDPNCRLLIRRPACLNDPPFLSGGAHTLRGTYPDRGQTWDSTPKGEAVRTMCIWRVWDKSMCTEWRERLSTHTTLFVFCALYQQREKLLVDSVPTENGQWRTPHTIFCTSGFGKITPPTKLGLTTSRSMQNKFKRWLASGGSKTPPWQAKLSSNYFSVSVSDQFWVSSSSECYLALLSTTFLGGTQKSQFFWVLPGGSSEYYSALPSATSCSSECHPQLAPGEVEVALGD